MKRQLKGKTKKIQFLTRSSLGGNKIESLDIDSNRLLPSDYFSEFGERLVFPTPSVRGFTSHSFFMLGTGAFLSNLALMGSVGLFAVSLVTLPFGIFTALLLIYRKDLSPVLILFLVPLLVGIGLGLYPNITKEVRNEVSTESPVR